MLCYFVFPYIFLLVKVNPCLKYTHFFGPEVLTLSRIHYSKTLTSSALNFRLKFCSLSKGGEDVQGNNILPLLSQKREISNSGCIMNGPRLGCYHPIFCGTQSIVKLTDISLHCYHPIFFGTQSIVKLTDISLY